MSDEQTPAWAEAMERRIIGAISQAIADREARLMAEMARRFDQMGDDLTVNTDAAGSVMDRVRRLAEDVNELRQAQVMILRRLRQLEHWRDSRPEAQS